MFMLACAWVSAYMCLCVCARMLACIQYVCVCVCVYNTLCLPISKRTLTERERGINMEAEREETERGLSLDH